MKKITTYLVVRDINGIAQTGATVNVYPAGTTNEAGIIITHQGGGLYKIEINPAINEQCISKFYDIYLEGVKRLESQFFEDWVWFVANKEVDAEQTFTFADLTDENGEVLPTTIEEAEIKLIPQRDRGGYISAQSDTDFTITLYSAGGADKGLFDVHIVVKT